MKSSKWVITGVLLVFLALTQNSQASEQKVSFPTGYKQWSHIKSMVIEPGHPLENPFQGLHHVYANPIAIKGFKEGIFPDGSILVFDLVQDKKEGKTIQEGERKLVGVMQKDKTVFKKTGGWGFEGFAGNSQTERLVKDNGIGCFSCHESQEKQDYIFSAPRK
ncbi:MAG: cytochrome P460 family protein [Candidatus Nitronauta litoralis]|uniref:Cytochrome P460 family protein n=1 Tax=Candidatus Nitronauta litoralis TaxID=2705533 RepID=A0A7T0G135_9BACT|nr:MAG: cytochrome P460 family protein [Candidatus Nitronauta litoralis]